MAFQKGSQIRPELMRGDMSGFAQAAQFKAQEGQMWGQAMQNLGEQIGGVIKQKQVKEEKAAKDKAAVNILVAQGIAPADAEAAVKSGMSDTILSMSQQDKKMKAEAEQFAQAQAVREAALGIDQQRADIAKAAETRQTTEGAADIALRQQVAGQGQARVDIAREAAEAQAAQSEATLALAEREMALKEEIADRTKTPAEIAKAEAELRQTQLENVKIIAQTEDIEKGGKNYDIKLLETEVGDVTFADYLQELTQTKKIKGGELHQKGLLNFDEDQIAAFDSILRNNPQFLEGMPEAVKKYYGAQSLPGGGSIRITPRK